MRDEVYTGLYDEIISESLKNKLQNLDPNRFKILMESLDEEEASLYLSKYIQLIVKESIEKSKKHGLDGVISLSNKIINFITSEVSEPSFIEKVTNQILKAVFKNDGRINLNDDYFVQPGIPLAQSELLVNARGEYRIGNELKKEIQSADQIDLICSFIKWSGIRIIKDELTHFTEKGKVFRVITTVYMGASDQKAIDFLKHIGAQVKVSFDTRRTRLHAKAWNFHRKTGYTTAYIGSSNLSASAQTDGLEWNVRLSALETPHLIKKFEATFNNYWNDPEFENYDPQTHSNKLYKALKAERDNDNFQITLFDIKPYPFQKEIIEKLTLEREKGYKGNLVVAATGTGKTVISAFDYKTYSNDFQHYPKLLFVAHRKEILKQSLQTFRQVLKNGSFGELLVDGLTPEEGNHVFASIQSLHASDFNFDPKTYDVVIIDEFHHAEAETYRKLLNHIQPKYLLGLTATPERSDGLDVREFFGNRIAAELRVWDAIDRGLLSPFQYFGIHDNTDLTKITWNRGKYNQSQLQDIYLNSEQRLGIILNELNDKIENIQKMCALGFCVSIQHANYMADKFNQAGIKSISLSGNTDRKERDRAIDDLRKGNIQIIFTVDLFNEGIDLPEVDTLLLLRPTESSTLFLQQLGRGLRLNENKECLTVLDFIGFAHKSFRFDTRFRSLTNIAGKHLVKQIQNDFPILPSGCNIQLDRQSKEIVLDNVKSSISNTKSKIISEIRHLKTGGTLKDFILKTGFSLKDIYRNHRYFTDLLRQSNRVEEIPNELYSAEREFGKAMSRVLHVDNLDRLNWYRDCFKKNQPPKSFTKLSDKELTYLRMWVALFGKPDDFGNIYSLLKQFWQFEDLKKEYLDILDLLVDNISHLPVKWDNQFGIDLDIHCYYTRDEVISAFNDIRNGRLHQPREGVYFNKRTKCNLFFVTLDKSEKEYSPTTMYRDYAISDNKFHWQSQSTTRPSSKKGKRHVYHKEKGITPLLFLRKSKKDDRNVAEPYFFAGPLEIESYEGSNPMNIIWKLKVPLPADIYKMAAVISS